MTTAIERAAARRLHQACVEALEAAKTHAEGLWDALARVHEMEAWRVHGFTSFASWAQKELDVSERQSYRYLAKARASVELGIASGKTTEEAAESVPLTPTATPTPCPERTQPEIVADWAKPVRAAIKLTSSIIHLRVGDLTPSAREALTDLLTALETVLRAR